jgi:hypothetical protein
VVNVDGRVQAQRACAQVGPQPLASLVDVLDEVLQEVKPGTEARDLASLRAALRALPALKDLVWSGVDPEPRASEAAPARTAPAEARA